MTDFRIAQIADILIHYSLDAQPGQKLLIRVSTLAEPLIREAYRSAMQAGAHIVTQVSLPGLEKIFMDHATNNQLTWISPLSRIVSEEFDAMLAIQSEYNTREGTGFDPKNIGQMAEANQPLRDAFFARAAAGEMKWCATLFPTAAHAQDDDMALEDYETFVFNACLPDRENPIRFWQNMENRQNKLVEYLNNVSEIRLVATDTDLIVHVADRKWINCAGRENFPDGEVFTGPIENRKRRIHN